MVVSDREEVEGDLIRESSATSATSSGTEQMRAPTERLPPTREGPFITKVDEVRSRWWPRPRPLRVRG